MATSISTLTVLNQYVNGVMDRADHHAHNVNEIVLTIAGAVVWRATQDIEVRTNILWFTINHNRYVLAFNHDTGDIELRDRSQQGTVLHTFNNSTTAIQVRTIFRGL